MFSIIRRTENSLCKIAAKLYFVGRWTLWKRSIRTITNKNNRRHDSRAM